MKKRAAVRGDLGVRASRMTVTAVTDQANGESDRVVISNGLARDILTHNETGSKVCGWRP
jgi:hypothetical protein